MESNNIKEFDLVFKEYSDAIFGYFSNRLNDRELAKDLTQETFLKFWNYYLKDNKEVKYKKTLLFTIAHNILVNTYERNVKHESLDEMIEDGFEIRDDIETSKIIEKAETNILKKILKKIPPDDKEILYLRYNEGLSIREISEIVEQNENNISVRIHRIIEKIKKDYE
jgi:RNA polymerase sigma factor (sigma-70 family)